jgi:hypothetical protein
MNRSTVVGVFENRIQAEKAMRDLEVAGFTSDQIGFVMKGDSGQTTVTETDTGPSKTEGAVGGVLAGAGVGAMIGAAASLLVPGIGPVLAGGILAASLGGAAMGAAAGGVLGGLVAAGVPEEEARVYESDFNAGRMLVTVRAGGRAMEAEEILRRNGATGQRARPAA